MHQLSGRRERGGEGCQCTDKKEKRDAVSTDAASDCEIKLMHSKDTVAAASAERMLCQ